MFGPAAIPPRSTGKLAALELAGSLFAGTAHPAHVDAYRDLPTCENAGNP